MGLSNTKPDDDVATKPRAPLGEFDCVRLLRDIPASEAVMWMYDDQTADRVVAGSTGAIIHTLKAGEMFIVEISDPIPALVDVGWELLERI